MSKKIIEIEGEYIIRIPCKDNKYSGFEITINSGQPTDKHDATEMWDIGKNGLTDGFVEFRGYDNKTGWESKWKCSLESLLKMFVTRIK